MSKKVAPRVQLNFAPEVEEQDLADENTYPDESLPVEVPQVIERDEIVENDIFDLKVKESAKEDIVSLAERQEEPEPETTAKHSETKKPQPKKQPIAKQPKKTDSETKPAKKKRQLSEEHKAKLALAREKALATRRAKAEEKKKMKEIENKTKELKKKKAQKDLEELEDEVVNKKSVQSSPSGASQPTQGGSIFTKQDLENAQLDAIMKYEAIRKARKEEKKKQQMIEQQKKDLQKKIQGYGARDANGRLLNKWDRCY